MRRIVDAVEQYRRKGLNVDQACANANTTRDRYYEYARRLKLRADPE
jgi:hypothetical protein